MNRHVSERRFTPFNAVYSIDFIRGRAHEAFLEMERALPYGCDIEYCGVTVRADPIDYGDDGRGFHYIAPGLKYYQLNVRVLLPETTP